MSNDVITVPPATVSPILGQPFTLADAQMIDDFRAVVATSAAITAVDSDDQCAYARAVMNEAGRLAKQVEGARTAAKKPYHEAGKKIDAVARLWTDRLDAIVAKLRGVLGEYTLRVEAAQQAALAEQRRREAEAEETARSTGNEVLLVTDIEIPASAPVATRTDYEVVIEDVRSIPAEYITVNTAAIKRAILAGTAVPGARLLEVKKIVNR